MFDSLCLEFENIRMNTIHFDTYNAKINSQLFLAFLLLLLLIFHFHSVLVVYFVVLYFFLSSSF